MDATVGKKSQHARRLLLGSRVFLSLEGTLVNVLSFTKVQNALKGGGKELRRSTIHGPPPYLSARIVQLCNRDSGF